MGNFYIDTKAAWKYHINAMTKFLNRLSYAIPVFFVLLTFLLTLAPAKSYAAANPTAKTTAQKWSALPVSIPDAVHMAPGEAKTITIKFKNTGLKEWRPEGKEFVSVYTWNQKYRNSAFAHDSWISPSQPAKISSPAWTNRIASFNITLKAPETIGAYSESFAIAAENTAWIRGGTFTIAINVREKTEKNNSEKTIQTPQTQIRPKTMVLLKIKNIEAKTGETKRVRLGFKNSGENPWNKRSIKFISYENNGTPENLVAFSNETWVSADTAVESVAEKISTGGLEFLDWEIKAPQAAGEYILKFAMFANGAQADGGEIKIRMKVLPDSKLSDGGIADANSQKTEQVIGVFNGKTILGKEPDVRVGLFKLEDKFNGAVEIETNGEYTLNDTAQNIFGSLPSGAKLALNYDTSKGKYRAVGSGLNITSDLPFIISPAAPTASEPQESIQETMPHFTIINLEDRPSWNKSINYNKFRGTLEIKFSEKNKKTWAINQLPLEQYLWGLAETSDNRASEFQKALANAARTYAYYFIQSGIDNGETLASNKHKDRGFHIDSVYDQVYKGMERESIFLKFKAAAIETAGIIAHYGSNIAITPYFSRSDGRTKLWSEVWGGGQKADDAKPWIKTANSNYDDGLKLWGHGVGMSLHDARKRAEIEGLNATQILNYYFNGLELVKKY